MANPFYIAGSEGFDIYEDASIQQNFPWFILNQANAAQVTSGTGAFPGAKSFTMNVGTTAAYSTHYQFPNGGTFTRNNTGTNGKLVLAFNGWVRVESLPTNTNAQILLAWATAASNATTGIPFLGVQNTAANGLNLLFPSTVAGIATAPYMMAIELNQYYWVSLRFAIYPNAQLRASYTVNGVPLQQNIPLTFGSDPLGTTAICDRVAFYTSTTGPKYSIDDMVIQASNGSRSDWPAGFTEGVPNNPTADTLPNITPRRIYKLDPVSNGSVNQWQSSDPELENFQAATTPGNFVEALDAEQVDLYKFAMPAGQTLTDCIGVVTRAQTNKYLSIEPAMKDTAGDDVVANPGIVTKGTSRFISIQEQTAAGEAWDTAKLTAAEFGQKSI